MNPDDLREDSVDVLHGGLVLEGGAVIIGSLRGEGVKSLETAAGWVTVIIGGLRGGGGADGGSQHQVGGDGRQSLVA